MSKLFELAKRLTRRVLQSRSTLKVPPSLAPLPPGGLKSRPGAPPIVSRSIESVPSRNQPTPQEERDIKEVKETFDSIQLLGRDRGHSDEMQAVMDGMRRVSSSNVYGYFFEVENPGSGILYVTFLGKSSNASRSASAGETYAYYDVSDAKFDEFQRASESSAGGAVWDYLRVRKTSWDHQHRYRLVQSHGDYVPRKATQSGFKSRQLLPAGQPKIPNATWAAISRLEHSRISALREYGSRMKRELLAANQVRSSTLGATTRKTLQPRSTLRGRSPLSGRPGQPNRATPNRGSPNRA